MALGHPIQIRLNLQKQLDYEDEAARQGKPLSTFLRERLEADDSLRTQFDALREEVRIGVTAIRSALEDRADNTSDPAILLELLLLLREISGPDKTRRAQAEVLRQGLKIWTPK